MALIVQKYGGQILSTPTKIKSIAKKIQKQIQKGNKIIAVVSAMGSSTDEFISLSYKVSNKPKRRELDMLLSVGERISMSLLSMALNDLKINAKSFTGSQSGIITENDFTQARIIDVRPIRIEKELASHDVIIIAGFQGVSEIEKEITTLGRGGTDTTAIAIAHALKADKVEILKEVGGIYSSDPKKIKSAKIYRQLPYDVVLEACYWGAKILHFRAVELAKKLNIPIEIQHIHKPKIKTLINGDSSMLETKKIATISSQKNMAVVTFKGDVSEATQTMSLYLKRDGLPWPQILATENNKANTLIFISSSDESLKNTLATLKKSKQLKNIDESLCSISATCFGSTNSSLSTEILEALNKEKISVKKIIYTPQTITVLVNKKDNEKAVQCLHKLI